MANKVKRILLRLFLLVTIINFLSIKCNKSEPAHIANQKNITKKQNNTNSSEYKKHTINFSKEELEYITTLRVKGSLVIATRNSPVTYYQNRDGTISGFAYHLTKDFANYLGVKARYKLVSFSDYFTKDGVFPKKVITDSNYSYTPDLIEQVDIIADELTIIPWRQKLFRFVKVSLIKDILISRKGEEIKNINDLVGKTIAIVPASSFLSTLKTAEKKLGKKFNYLEFQTFDETYEAVSNRKADFLVEDSNAMGVTLKDYPNLNYCIAISNEKYIGWAVKKNNEVLAGILKKYLRYAHETGFFAKHWLYTFGLDYLKYLKIIGIHRK